MLLYLPGPMGLILGRRGRAVLRLPLCRTVYSIAFFAESAQRPAIAGRLRQNSGCGCFFKKRFSRFLLRLHKPASRASHSRQNRRPPALLAGSRGAGGLRGALCPAGVQLGSLSYPSLFGTTASGISLAGGKILHFWRSRPAKICRILRPPHLRHGHAVPASPGWEKQRLRAFGYPLLSEAARRRRAPGYAFVRTPFP